MPSSSTPLRHPSTFRRSRPPTDAWRRTAKPHILRGFTVPSLWLSRLPSVSVAGGLVEVDEAGVRQRASGFVLVWIASVVEADYLHRRLVVRREDQVLPDGVGVD